MVYNILLKWPDRLGINTYQVASFRNSSDKDIFAIIALLAIFLISHFIVTNLHFTKYDSPLVLSL